MKTILLLLFLIAEHNAFADEPSPTLEFFPAQKLFPTLSADGLAHQFSISRVTDNREWIAAIGGAIPTVQLTFPDVTMQGTIAVTIFNRLIKTPGQITVYTIDYKVDVPIDFRFDDVTLRVAAGHISCHFADDGIELLGKHSIQHVNDYITLIGTYNIPLINGYVYGGFNYSYGTQPIQFKPWLFQIGTHFGNYRLHKDISLYGAIDVKVREENGWGSTRSIQVGARFFPDARMGLRLAYTLRMGFEERGQFYLNKTTLNLLTAFFDF